MNNDPRFEGGAPLVWLLMDDRAGNRSQCRGVAEALGLRFQLQDLEYNAKGALPNFVMGASFGGLTASSRVNLAAPWPDLVVAAGRRTAPVARHIKNLNDGKTFLAQVMYPGDTGADEFDLIAVPRHDGLPERPNLFPITGAPHRITENTLAVAARDWAGKFDALPRPRIALLVGGGTKRRAFDSEAAAGLGRAASEMAAAAGGSLLVSTSRRTGEAAEALISAITAPHHAYRWGDEGDNPYVAYLALADGVVVTGDSVSMCSEACATAGPVYIHAPGKRTVRKHAELHRELYENGYARPFDGGFEAWTHPRLNAAADIAAEIRHRLGLGS